MRKLSKIIQRVASYKPGTPEFRSVYSHFLDTLDEYIERRLDIEGLVPDCVPGCCECCLHWVTDVFSFETIMIGSELIENKRGEYVRDILKQDIRVFEGVCSERWDEEGILKEFHKKRRPCPLLDDSGRCMVYHIRPITCRLYFCTRDGVKGESGFRPFILGIDEEINQMLESIHEKHDRFSDNTLRVSVLEYLEYRFGY